MSFILDALKKAEAERHMGQIPGLHAQPAVALPVAAAPARTRKAALGAAAMLLIVAAVALAWLQPWQERASPLRVRPPEEPVTFPAVAVPAPAAPSIVAQPADPAQQIVAVMPPPETSKPEKRPPKPRKPPVRQATAPQKASVTAARSSAAPDTKALTVASSTVPAAASRPPAGQAAQSRSGNGNGSDSDLRQSTALVPEPGAASLRELPEQIQRELPNLAIGGYIYSDNPRERQLLVNKRLLHEGQEAAPGVILERMMPKAAVFNYKGYRYRVAY